MTIVHQATYIPDSIAYKSRKYRVYHIDEEVFLYNRGIKTVRLPDLCTSVSFCGSSVEDVEFPKTAVSIERGFESTDKITTLDFVSKYTQIGIQSNQPSNVKHVIFHGDAFIGWMSLCGMESIEFGDGKITVSHGAMTHFQGDKLEIGCNTMVGEQAFRCSEMSELIIRERSQPDYPYEIFANAAFTGCFNLKKIVCHNVTPPNIHPDTFLIAQSENPPSNSDQDPEVYERCYLYVPQAAIEAYKAHEAWGKFTHIVGIENSVNAVAADTYDSSCPSEYYDLTGRRIDNPAPGSVVIQRQGNSTSKHIVQ